MSKRRKYQDVSDLALPDAAGPSKASVNRAPSDKPPGLPLDVRLPLRIIGSLSFGIVLLCVLIVLFAWGTFIESEYGASVAKFVLYGSRWFALLLLLLAVNLLCSMLSRLPWRRHHLPFLLAHGGMIVLLAGCWVTWQYGLEAQISLPEGTAGKMATRMNRQHFTLGSIPHSGTPRPAEVSIPFEPGPFNWEDYDTETWSRRQDRRYGSSVGFAMRWGHRDRGVLATPDRDVRIKVLDYCASSTATRVPPLELDILWKKMISTTTELGDVRETPRTRERVRLEIRSREHFGMGMEFRGTQSTMAGGERVSFCVASSSSEITAFQNGKPDWSGKFGQYGQLVLYYDDRNHYIDVDQLLRETEGEKRFSLPGTPFQIGEVRFRERGLLVSMTIFAPDGEKDIVTLFADNPEMNVSAQMFGVFGSYWVSPERLSQSRPELAAGIQKLARPRLDFMQGPDGKLHYRYWTGANVASTGVVPEREPGRKVGFTVAAETPEEGDVIVERFAPQDLPGLKIEALPVGRERGTEQRVRLEVTVDGKSDVFWLRAVYPTVVPLPPERDQVRFVYGKGRTVRLQWEYDTVDLGFGVFLKQFEMRTEPGTRMSSHYSSRVDFVEMGGASEKGFSRSPNEFRPFENGRDIVISMNQPAVFQGTGRNYRIYQSSYMGPYHPGNFRFHELYDGKIFPWEEKPRETLYMSTLSVNDDPGRGLKYLGSFLLIFGTAWFVYRRKPA